MAPVVGFVGGPLDGHQHPIGYGVDELSTEVRLEVAPEVLRVLTGETDEPIGLATSIAVYRLIHDDYRLQYRHVHSVAPNRHRTEQP